MRSACRLRGFGTEAPSPLRQHARADAYPGLPALALLSLAGSESSATLNEDSRVPWNKGKLIGQKPPLKVAEIWTVRTQLRMVGSTRELALFNLAIDSKLRGCDLVSLRVRDVAHSDQVLRRASIVQQKTRQPVRFELTEQTRDSVGAWIAQAGLSATDYLFPSRRSASAHLSVRQYARLVKQWVALMGADPTE